MIPQFVLALLCPLDGLDRESTWRSSLEAGDYAQAWSLAQAEPDGVGRDLARASILYRAGDPVGALAAAESGLRAEADHLELLHHAAAAALWLEDGESALEYSSHLLRVVDSERGSAMSPTDREAWRASARSFLELGHGLLDRKSTRLNSSH